MSEKKRMTGGWNRGLHPYQWMPPEKYQVWKQKNSKKRNGTTVQCANCGKTIYKSKFWLERHKRHFCSNICRLSFTRGAKHHDWRGGRFIAPSKGYVMVNVGGGSRPEHILIAEKLLGRRLPKGICVHHINYDKTDNRKGNLLICSRTYHAWLEKRMAELYAEEHFRGD